MANEQNQTEGNKDQTTTNEDPTARNEGGDELERRSRQSQEERSEVHTTESRKDSVCSFCKGDKTVVADSSDCCFCGEEFVGSADSLGGSALLEEPAAAAENVVESLPTIPHALITDSVSSETRGDYTNSSCSERSLSNVSPAVCCPNIRSLKIPRQGGCNFTESVQVPGQTTVTTFFLMELVNRSEKLLYLCFVPSGQKQQVYERIIERERMTFIRPLRDERLPGFENYFHEITMLAGDQLKVSIQLTMESQGTFRIRYPLVENVISLYDIKSRSLNRLCPGARVPVCTECTGNPGELYQGTIRVRVVNATGTRSMIFPILAFGPSN